MSLELDDCKLTTLILKYTPRDRRRKIPPEDWQLLTALKELQEWRTLARLLQELAAPDRRNYDD